MPKIKSKQSSNKTVPANQQKGKKVCNFCHKTKNLIDYYISKNPLYSVDKRVPICKECIANASLNEDGSINDLKLNKILKTIDRPYYKDMIESAEQSIKKKNSYIRDEDIKYHGKEILSKYFMLIARPQDVERSYFDSEKDNFIHQSSNKSVEEKRKIAKKYADISNTKNSETEKRFSNTEDFQITNDIIELFGEGYSVNEYKKMHNKYEKLKMNYSLQTNLHQEALTTYVRFKVKEEVATAEGNVEEAKKWYDAAQNAADKGKLTPKQLTQADLQGGINSFSEIFKAVEQAVDVIPILPQFKYRPNDACDFIIWCYINYARDLQGLPPCKYEDVYKFYNKKKEEYISQYGDPYHIFDEDPSDELKENIKRFITLPNDYEEGDS